MSFKPFAPDLEIIRYRRNLPHWRQAGATYFVTYRTADSIPQSRLRCMQEQRCIWVKLHPLPWSIKDWDEYHRLQFGHLDRWLDSGHGACPMGDSEVAHIVANSMTHFDESRYILDEFVVMPNHVHALVMPLDSYELEEILHSWKSVTAQQINNFLGREGTFWMHENYDRIVRSWEELDRIRDYIRRNPAKPRLRQGQYLLGSGSGIY